jgi:hypothetical protein
MTKFLNRAGYIVYANDHRGHWKIAVTTENARFAGEDGWNGIVRDAKQLTDIILRQELRALAEKNLDGASFEEKRDVISQLDVKVYPSEESQDDASNMWG